MLHATCIMPGSIATIDMQDAQLVTRYVYGLPTVLTSTQAPCGLPVTQRPSSYLRLTGSGIVAGELVFDHASCVSSSAEQARHCSTVQVGAAVQDRADLHREGEGIVHQQLGVIAWPGSIRQRLLVPQTLDEHISLREHMPKTAGAPDPQ